MEAAWFVGGVLRKVVNEKMISVGLGWRKLQELALKMLALPCVQSVDVEPTLENGKMMNP